MLITTIAEIKAVMRISNLDVDESIPDISAAQESRLLPFLGAAFIAVLQATKDATELTDPQPSDLLKSLLLTAQKALAYFAYHDDLGSIHARLTDAGVRRNTTDNMPAAFRWEYNELKDVLIGKAYQALESLLATMEFNKAEEDLVPWVESDAYQRRKKYLVKSPADFNERFFISQPYRTYHLLQGCMSDADKLWITGAIGKEFYEELKAIEDPADETAVLIDMLKDASVNLTISQAFRKLPVEITPHGLSVLYGRGDSANAEKTMAPDSNILMVRNAAEADGRAYLAKCMSYLQVVASESVFPTFFSSSLYKGVVTYNRGNSTRKMFRF